MQPGHRVGEFFFFFGPPPKELLQSPVLVAGVGVAVAAQQPDHPPLDVLPTDLLPPGPTGLGDQVGRSEPLDRLGVHPHRLARLTLGRQGKPERADLGLEHSRGERLRPPGARFRHAHSLSLFLPVSCKTAPFRPAFPLVRDS